MPLQISLCYARFRDYRVPHKRGYHDLPESFRPLLHAEQMLYVSSSVALSYILECLSATKSSHRYRKPKPGTRISFCHCRIVESVLPLIVLCGDAVRAWPQFGVMLSPYPKCMPLFYSTNAWLTL